MGRKFKPLHGILIITALLIAAALFLFCRSGSKQLISVSRNAIEMGTAVSLTVYAKQGRQSEEKCQEALSQLSSRILDLIGTLDRETLSWRGENSEVYRFNHLAEAGPMSISPELAEVIRGSLKITRASRGAMDITLRPVIELWGIESFDGKTAYVPPSPETLEAAAALAGAEHLKLSAAPSGKNLLEKDIPGLCLDLGAVGKGYALDLAAALLADSPAAGAVLAAGGSILTYGDKGRPWQIGIRNPEGSPSDTVGIISIPGESGKKTVLSTSGGYEKYVEFQGKVYEHIIDGRTMYPAESDLYSATVITKDSGLASDGLSTACYLLGMEESLPLLESQEAEAVFITRDKRIWLTKGIAGSFSLTDPEYTIAGIL